MTPLDAVTSQIEARLASLDLAQKVDLLTGGDHWHTVGAPDVGLRPIRFSDGPAGVRGPAWDESCPSLSLPSATVLASTWDAELALRYGAVLAGEAARRGVDVVLAPTVNIHRSPFSGRNFEAFSEDPELTSTMAAAVVRGLQRHGVAATVKHYVGNDYETDRFTASTEVSQRALREVYLRPFEAAIVDSGAWAVMSAYNRINGVPASENPLLASPLKDEWGFDGPVVSDWGGVRSIAAARAAQDIVMPGPGGPWGAALLKAVVSGEVEESAVDDKIRRLLRLAARVGAVTGSEARYPSGPGVPEGTHLARTVAAEGMVLLSNRDEVLPLDPAQVSRVAVIGHNAVEARFQGGGSATVLPEQVVSPLDAIREALPSARVDHGLGAVVQRGVAGLSHDELTHPVSADPGVRVTFRDANDHILHEEHRLSTDLVWFGGNAPVLSADRLDLDFIWTPTLSGTVRFGIAAGGRARVEMDGALVVEGKGEVRTPQLGANPLTPPSISAPVDVRPGGAHRIAVHLRLSSESRGQAGLMAVRVGTEPVATSSDLLIDEAARSAAAADVAIVVVGTNSDVESEGFDRDSLALPGAQDDLVRAVAATGTPTVAVVNAGAPVLLPWRDDVGAVLTTGFAGQEMGPALADVLLGIAEPGGRLPTTWPTDDSPPVARSIPRDGAVEYREGIHIGYRAWLREGRMPAFPFGHGLGYTTWTLSSLEVTGPRAGTTGWAEVTATNTGDRPGKQVVQLYLRRPVSEVDRPYLWLAGHAVVRADPGGTTTVRIEIPWRSLAHWEQVWHLEPGAYEVHVGTSSADLALRGSFEVR